MAESRISKAARDPFIGKMAEKLTGAKDVRAPRRITIVVPEPRGRGRKRSTSIPKQITIPSISLGTSLGTTVTTEQLMAEAEREKPERELGELIERGLRTPIKRTLGTDFPGAPESAKFFEELAVGIGTPIFIAGVPEVRKKAVEVIRKRPEKISEIALTAAAFPIISGADIIQSSIQTQRPSKGTRVQEAGVGRVLGKGATALTILGVAAAAGVLAPKFIPRTGRTFKGAAKPRIVKPKLKPKIVFTAKDLLRETLIKEARKPEPPKITQVIDKGNSIEFIVRSGGKIVERRIVAKTDTALLKSQLSAARQQGAKFVGLKAPKSPREIIFGEPARAAPLIRKAPQEKVIDISRAAFGITQKPKRKAFALTIPRELLDMQTSLQKQTVLQESRISQASKEAQRQVSVQSQTFQKAQSQAQAQAQAQSQSQAETQAFAQAFAPKAAVPKARAVRKPFRPRPIIGLPTLEFPAAGFGAPASKGKAGYDTFIKEKGRVRQLNQRVRTKKGALSIGALFTDLTPTASFTIRPSKKQAEINGGGAWDILKHKFRKRKTRTALELVEKSKFRLDSIGEITGISLLGGAKKKKKKDIDIRKKI